MRGRVQKERQQIRRGKDVAKDDRRCNALHRVTDVSILRGAGADGDRLASLILLVRPHGHGVHHTAIDTPHWTGGKRPAL